MIQHKFNFIILFCSASLVGPVTGLGFQEPDAVGQTAVLTDTDFATWRNRIQADESELQWQNLPWETSYRAGLLRASAEDKPLLLWVMNGHPLGCT